MCLKFIINYIESSIKGEKKRKEPMRERHNHSSPFGFVQPRRISQNQWILPASGGLPRKTSLNHHDKNEKKEKKRLNAGYAQKKGTLACR